MKILFPCRLYSEIFDISDEYNSQLKFEIMSLTPRATNKFEVRTTYMKTHIRHNPVFSEFISKIEKEASQYAGRPVSVSEIWANIAEHGSFHVIHHHSPSPLSGVYYVDSPSNLHLKFISDKDVMNGNEYTEPIETKKLLLFEGWVLHGHDPIPTQEPKISLAFNFAY